MIILLRVLRGMSGQLSYNLVAVFRNCSKARFLLAPRLEVNRVLNSRLIAFFQIKPVSTCDAEKCPGGKNHLRDFPCSAEESYMIC